MHGFHLRCPDYMGLQWDVEICIFSKLPVAESQTLDYELGNNALRSHCPPVLEEGEHGLGRYGWHGSSQRVVSVNSVLHYGRVRLKEKRKNKIWIINSAFFSFNVLGHSPICMHQRKPTPDSTSTLPVNLLHFLWPCIVFHLGHGCCYFPFMNNSGLYLGIFSH